jgi:hypothetical protein
MNISSGIRVLVLLVMTASMVVSLGCTDIVELLVCGELSHWNFSKFRCVGPDREKMKAVGEAHDKCDEEGGEWLETSECSYAAKNNKTEVLNKCEKEGGEWMQKTNTCSFAARDNKTDAQNKCEEEGGTWVPWSQTCSFAAKNNKTEKAANNNTAAKPDKQPDKSNAK